MTIRLMGSEWLDTARTRASDGVAVECDDALWAAEDGDDALTI